MKSSVAVVCLSQEHKHGAGLGNHVIETVAHCSLIATINKHTVSDWKVLRLGPVLAMHPDKLSYRCHNKSGNH